MTTQEATAIVAQHLARLFDSRHQGTSGTAYARSQGYVDGYMQALVDMGVVTEADLLAVVAAERRAAGRRADTVSPVGNRRTHAHGVA